MKRTLAVVVATLALALAALPAAAQPPGLAPLESAGGEAVDQAVVLADLGFRNGVRAVFTLDASSGDYGLIQDGRLGETGPVAPDPDGLLVAYLEITPRELPVPRELLGEWPEGARYPQALTGRSIVPAPVVAADLMAPSNAAAAGQTCWSTYYDPYHWFDQAGYPNPGSKIYGAKTYYSSQFGGMARYSRSYLANCGSFPVRHRIYYKSLGTYYVHHDYDVPAWHWQAVKKGSVHRYRKVHYDYCQGCTRNGRFTG